MRRADTEKANLRRAALKKEPFDACTQKNKKKERKKLAPKVNMVLNVDRNHKAY